MTDRDEREELEIHDDQPQEKTVVINPKAKPEDRSEDYYESTTAYYGN